MRKLLSRSISSLVVSVCVLASVVAPSAGASQGSQGTTQPRLLAGPRLNYLQVLPEELVQDLLVETKLIHPDVAASLRFELKSLNSSGLRLLAAREAVSDAEVRQLVAYNRQALLRAKVSAALLVVGEAEGDYSLAIEAVEEAESGLTALAVSTFVLLEEGSTENPSVSGDTTTFEVVAKESRSRAQDRVLTDRELRQDALDSLTAAKDVVAGLRADLAEQVEIENNAISVIEAAVVEIAELEPKFERWLMQQTVLGADFPVVVFDAYYKAALSLAEWQPSCKVSWYQLAGIGKVESRHGSFGGNTVGSDGRTDGEILGPVLDGEPFAAIVDTDGGSLDGNVVWDRAVGPMQFIPGSWSIYGQDGNDDGVKDPHNIYDAAEAAGAHLCGTTGGLDSPGNFQLALLGYNHSDVYGIQVMGLATAYERSVGPIKVAPAIADASTIQTGSGGRRALK